MCVFPLDQGKLASIVEQDKVGNGRKVFVGEKGIRLLKNGIDLIF